LNEVKLLGGGLLDFGILPLNEGLDRGYVLTVDVDIELVAPCGSRTRSPHSYSKIITREQVKNDVVSIAVPVDAHTHPYTITLTVEKSEINCRHDESIGWYVHYTWISSFKITENNALPPSSFYMSRKENLCYRAD